MKELFRNLETLLPLNHQVKEDISQCISIITAPAHTRLVMAGQLSPDIYYLKEGVVRNFEITDDKEWTNWFFKKGEFAFSVDSLLLNKPTSAYMESCTKVVLYAIAKQDFQLLIQKHESVRDLTKILAGIYFNKVKKQVYYASQFSPWTRYRLFITKNPYIATRVQSNHLASYLGVFPSSISRYRKRVSREDNQSYR